MKPYYADDFVTLYHGDCLEVMAGMDEASVDLVLTDPPYGHNNNNNNDLAHRREAALGIRAVTDADARPIANDGEEATPLAGAMFTEAARLLKPGCCCCCCCCGGGGGGPDPQFARWSLMLDATPGLDFKQMVVWDKGGLGMGWHYRRSYEVVLVGEKPGAACRWFGGHDTANIVRDITGIKPSATDHPTPKPQRLMSRFIAWHTAPDDLVLDPFAGSGTTLVAAKALGRHAIGIELEERYCEMAAKRLAQEVLPL